MKRYPTILQAGDDVAIHFTYLKNQEEPIHLEDDQYFYTAIYDIKDTLLLSGSTLDESIETVTIGDNTIYKWQLTHEETEHMPEKTRLEIVVKDQDGIVNHANDDVMLVWNYNRINNLIDNG